MISEKILGSLTKSSWIREMFEEGNRLRSIYGPDKVFDFTLGNPDIEPPKVLNEILKQYVLQNDPGMHQYMSNAGYTDVRDKVARLLQRETGLPLTSKHIVMTCGAAGGLNVVLKTLLNPGDEVIVFAPYFVEYMVYIDNHGGKPVVVPSTSDTFEPDLNAFETSITSRTKAIIINSPNNPTGIIYSAQLMQELEKILAQKQREYNTTICVVSDEPYCKLVYDNVELPSTLKVFKNSIVVNSFSKSLAIPGERIGYIAVNPAIQNVELLIEGFIFANRALGFVNAPALFQKVVAAVLDQKVDIKVYKERRDILYNYLTNLGFSCVKPQGAFYLFPKSLIPDDVEFVRRAAKYNLLLVPGQGFGSPGYFRIAYCVSLKTIENSLPAFEALVRELKK